MSDNDDLKFLSNALDVLDASDRVKRIEEQHVKERTALFREMLGVVDALRELERHCVELEDAGRGPTQLRHVQTITKMMLRLLEAHDVQPMDATGRDLLLEHHEVVGMREEEGAPPDIVLTEQQHGYLIGTRVLRQAKVIISR